MANRLTGIAWYGHQVMTGIVLLAKPPLEKTEYTPLALTEGATQDSDEWVGYQHLYVTSQTPSTRLQVAFLSDDYPGLTLENKLLEGKPARSGEDVLKETLSTFQDHPDPAVGRYVEELLTFYTEEQGVEIRVVPWEEELYELQKDNEFAGLLGLFFPIIHIYLPELSWSIVIRCEPVLGVEKESEAP